jgi:hypothetical protein
MYGGAVYHEAPASPFEDAVIGWAGIVAEQMFTGHVRRNAPSLSWFNAIKQELNGKYAFSGDAKTAFSHPDEWKTFTAAVNILNRNRSKVEEIAREMMSGRTIRA